ncbi:outer membrane protein assembly factor BamE [Psittacicella gerlachiana]|uniref:Outer membrane protein assembly factor BamE n=1 Tax=Psittacicella gerlachiana TaxID=2028574 RepID=A0A3A1YAV2_9GAMM|nr:outer membrane protein assembly factor BamE [Psittacicella gerlachiana]RIY35262.1 hypothetical protein CKF59_03880 [Psittacicella gerlachiana]
MRKFLLTCLAVVSIVGLSSCSIIYQPVKNEGSELDQAQIAQIQNGYTKEQVLYILGTPNVYKTLSEDSWYYISRIVNSRGKVSEKVFVVTFTNNLVSSFGYLDKPANQ